MANGEHWLVSCHLPEAAPEGTNHGVNAWCVTSAGDVVLVTRDGRRWGWPGGRPERGESSKDTLHREVAEEACSKVRLARRLGFTRSRCVDGPEAGVVLVRSIWRADVELNEWRSDYEIRDRKVVSPRALHAHLWMERGSEPVYERWLREARIRPAK